MYEKRTFLVGTAVETSAAITAAGFANTEIGMFTSSGVNVGGAIATSEWPLFVAQKQTDDLTKGTRKSYMIPYASAIKSVRVADYVAAAPMTKFIGYDGSDTTKTLSYDCETDYGIKFVIDSPYVRKYYNSYAGGGLKKTIHITTDCCEDCDAGCGTAVCYTETAKFVQKINDTNPVDSGIAFSIYNSVYAEMMLDAAASDTVTADAGFGTVTIADGTATFTLGSPTVTFSVNQTIPSGTYLRISPSNVSAPTNADPVYRVLTGVTAGTTITLDTPWQRATDTGIVTDSTLADSEIAAVVVSAVTACGIKITGKFVSTTTGCCCFPPFPWDVDGVTFIIANPDLGKLPCSALTITDGDDLTMGQGTYNQLIYDEMYAYGYSDIRQWFKDCAFNNNYTSYLTPGGTYSVFYIDYVVPVDVPNESLISGTPVSLEIAVLTANRAGFVTMVNLLGAAAGLPAVV